MKHNMKSIVLTFYLIILLISSAFLIFAINSCKADTIAPPPDVGVSVGWAIGTDLYQGWGVILHTTNSGISWYRQGNSTLMDSIVFYDVSAYTTTIAYVCGYKITKDTPYVFKTIDGGATWIKLNLPSFTLHKTLYSIRTDNNDVVWVGGSNNLVFRSLDGGADWDDRSLPISDTIYAFNCVSSDGPLRAVAGCTDLGSGNIGIFYMLDGSNWIQSTSLPPGWNRMLDVSWVKGTDLILAAGVNGVSGITCRSSNAGNSWVQVDAFYGSYTNAIFTLDQTYMWEGAENNNLCYSTNGGLTWTKNQVTIPWVGGISAVDNNNVWATGYDPINPAKTGFIIHSTDGGKSWQTQGLPDNYPTLWRISFTQ
jgi:photosystem II stability/assembly factor-like uncharacterized protein